MVTGSAIGTLVVFIISIIFVIYPISIPIVLPKLGPKRLPINLTTAPIIAIAVLWAAQCLGPKVIRDGIVGTDGVKPYNILILFFSLAYMSITLDITGVLQAAAYWVRNKGGSDGYKLFLYFYLMLTALSVFLGNDPVILSGTVFLVYYTQATGLNSMSWLISEFAAANTASMVLFVGNPTNVVICEGFAVNNAAFTAYTILPFLGCIIASFFALAFQFRSPKYIPRRLQFAEELDIWAVLHDPIGAWVGSILLGTCLVVIIVVSFFHVDVWKISLPFAVAKFCYDLAWDHYRSMKKNPTEKPEIKVSDESIQPGAEIVMEPSQEDQDPTDGNSTNTQNTLQNPPPRAVTFEQLPDSLPTAVNNTRVNSRSGTGATTSSGLTMVNKSLTLEGTSFLKAVCPQPPITYISVYARLSDHFPTFFKALPRLPFALVPFAFSQFILIEGLAHQGWIDIFANWLVRASGRQMFPVIWLVGVLGVILCNISGTNIGATILLTKVVRAAQLPDHSNRAAAIALAVASNIGAVSFTYSASLAGLLWRQILQQKGIFISQYTFAFWNSLPLLVMTGVGLAIVSAEMAVLY